MACLMLCTVWMRGLSHAAWRAVPRGCSAVVLAVLGLVLANPRLAGDTNPKIRVFVKESHSWSVSGHGDQGEDGGSESLEGGAKPQTAEIMKTIHKRRECRGIVVTIDRDKADYVLIIERLGGTDILSRDNKMALFDRIGDMVASSSTRSLGNAVKNACLSIRAH